MTSWRDVRAATAARLAAGGLEAAEAEARWLVEEVSGTPARAWGDEAVPTRARRRLDELVRRRLAGEPLQYVLGSWAFRHLDLMVDRRVLVPRPETEVVAEVAIAEARRQGLRRGRAPAVAPPPTAVVADLGTGSGALALALEAELPEVEVWATDVSPDAIAVARANVAGCGARRVHLAVGSWFDALPEAVRGRLAVVVANPPYLADDELATLDAVVRDHEPRGALAAGPTGLESLTVLVTEAGPWLRPGGALVVEHAPHQAAPLLDLARRHGWVDVAVHRDLAGRDRVLVARRAPAGV